LAIFALLLVWDVCALHTPEQTQSHLISDNISALAQEYRIPFNETGAMSDEDAAVYNYAVGSLRWNPKTIKSYTNETSFVNSAGTHGRIYHERVAQEASGTSLGFCDNYWIINQSRPASIGEYQKTYRPYFGPWVDDSSINAVQTGDTITFSYGPMGAIITPGAVTIIAAIISIAVYRRRITAYLQKSKK